MYRILIIDDDPGNAVALGPLLRTHGHTVHIEQTGSEGVRKAREFNPDLTLIDLRLPDLDGLDVLRAVRRQVPTTACVIVTGFGSCKSVVEAMRLGARDYLEKPISDCDVLQALTRLKPACVRWFDDAQLTDAQSHSLERWAALVVRAVSLPSDPKTLGQWGRSIGVSQGALRNWCHTAHLSARRSLLFTRLLRAVIKHQATGYAPENLLNIADRRTLVKMLIGGGGTSSELPGSVEEFLDRQVFILNPQAVVEVRSALGSANLLDAPDAAKNSAATHISAN